MHLTEGELERLLRSDLTREESIVGFDHRGLYDQLLEAARELASTDPQKAMNAADLALAVADRLDPAVYGEGSILNLQASALAARGNYKRVAEDFEGARTDLVQALGLLKEKQGDPLEVAAVLSYLGSLEIDLGRFEEALKLLDQAIPIYSQAGDFHQVGKILVKQATAIGYLQPDIAVQLLERASGLIEIDRDPHLELCLRHSLALFLNDSGRTEEAIGVLEDSRSLYRRFTSRPIQLRLRWLEGKIHRSLGHLSEAEETFKTAAADFLAKDLHQEHLLVSLDLAEARQAQGDRTRTLELCAGLYRIFESWHMHAEGLAVVLLFIRALREG